MTDLVVSVKLKADGSGLVGQCREAKTEVLGLGGAAATAGADAQKLAASTGSAATAARELGASAGQVTGAMEAVAAATRQASVASEKLATDQTKHTHAVNDNIRSVGQVKAGYFQLGQNLQDVGVQLSMGTGLMRVMALQGGQLATAIDMIGPKGAAGKVAAFFAGPWGAALLIGGSVLAPFIAKLFDENDALEEQEKALAAAEKAADSFGNAQSLLGKIIDLNTGKLKTNNAVLIETVKLQAQLNLLAANKQLSDFGKKTGTVASGVTIDLNAPKAGSTGMYGVGGGNLDKAVAAGAEIARQKAALQSILRDLSTVLNNDKLASTNPSAYSKSIGSAFNGAIAGVDKLAVDGKVAGKSLFDVKQQIIAIGTAANDKAAAFEALSVIAGGPVPGDLKPYSKPRKPKKAKSTDALDEFGRDAADKIAGILDSFDETPPALKRTNAAVRQLDDLIDDLQRKKPPNFEALIAGAERAKTVVQQGLNKPLDDFVRSQEQSLQILQLQVNGFNDQARAQQTINALERDRGPMTEAQKDAVLATVQALTAEERQLDIIHAKQQRQIQAVADVRREITDTIYDGVDALKDLPGRLLDTFKQYTAQFLTEQIFGPALRKLEDQVTGTHIVDSASQRMADAIDETNKPILSLGDAAGKAAAALEDIRSSSPTASTAGDVIPQSTLDAIDKILAPIGLGRGGGSAVDALGDIIVSGKKIAHGDISRPEDLISSITKALGNGIGLKDEAAAKLGKFAGKGFVGAMAGQQAAGLANLIGIRTNDTTATIGGAIGGMVGGPIGGAIGGLLGGIVGGLFHKTKQGGATITSTSGDAATFGNSRAAISAGGDAAGQVQAGIEQIAQQLGGALGAFDVSIGMYNGKWRVNPSGGSKLGGGGGKLGNQDFGKDGEADAIAYAIMDAIKDGAVTGLSTAVQKALHSSTDLNKALQEALKVEDIETLIGGVTGQIDKLFSNADAQAKERVDLARKYGLDVLAVEKANADDRAKLIDQTMQQSVGSLQDLLDNLKFGDLAEGSAGEKRQALLDEIANVKTKADAGDADAANQLAGLYSQLVSTSRDAYGTAGTEYASDRDTATAGAQEVIQAEADRIADAAGLTKEQTDAIIAGNSLADEANDLIATTNAKLDQISSILQAPPASTPTPDVSLTVRVGGGGSSFNNVKRV